MAQHPAQNLPGRAAACPECQFNPELWTWHDARSTIGAAAVFAELAVAGSDGLDIPGVEARLRHLVTVMADGRHRVESLLAMPTAGRVESSNSRGRGMLGDLQRESSLVAATLPRDPSVGNAERAELEAVLLGMTHSLEHGLYVMAQARAAAGDGVATSRGVVTQISVSDGGVPKRAVLRATVDRSGLVGDRQAHRIHHGKPWQALCLFSADVIDRLRAEGHPITAGAAGENLTVAGLDWTTLRSGLEIRIGTIAARLTSPATPCSANNQWFSDGDSRRIDHYRHPGWSRWYASVQRGGEVDVGDMVQVSEGLVAD